VENVT